MSTIDIKTKSTKQVSSTIHGCSCSGPGVDKQEVLVATGEQLLGDLVAEATGHGTLLVECNHPRPFLTQWGRSLNNSTSKVIVHLYFIDDTQAEEHTVITDTAALFEIDLKLRKSSLDGLDLTVLSSVGGVSRDSINSSIPIAGKLATNNCPNYGIFTNKQIWELSNFQ